MITYLNRVAVREINGGVSITRFSANDMTKYGFSDEDAFMSWYMEKRFPGDPFSIISEANIPKDQSGKWDRSQRGEWSLKNGIVEVDPVKVQAKEAKKIEQKDLITKMGLTEAEFKKLFPRGVI